MKHKQRQCGWGLVLSYVGLAGMATPIRWESRDLMDKEGGGEWVEIQEDSPGRENSSMCKCPEAETCLESSRNAKRLEQSG